MEAVNVSQISAIIKHHGCAALKGKNGNPTVAISNLHVLNRFRHQLHLFSMYLVGFAPAKSPPLFMELWDSVTMETETVPHPPELQSNSLFRPTLVPFDDTSVLLVNAEVKLGTPDPSYLQNIYKYTYGSGWTILSPNPSPLNTVGQSGVYLMKNPNLLNFDTLDQCSSSGELLSVFRSIIKHDLFSASPNNLQASEALSNVLPDSSKGLTDNTGNLNSMQNGFS